MATKISYMYRDASNYKTERAVILAGDLAPADVAAVKAALHEGTYFIPGQVGLPDLQDSFVGCESEWDPDRDHVWHEFLDIEQVAGERTPETPSAVEFVKKMREVTWDEGHVPACYDGMAARYRASVAFEG